MKRKEKIIHIKMTPTIEREIIFEIIDILSKYGYKFEKYLGKLYSEIIIARKTDDN